MRQSENVFKKCLSYYLSVNRLQILFFDLYTYEKPDAFYQKYFFLNALLG